VNGSLRTFLGASGFDLFLVVNLVLATVAYGVAASYVSRRDPRATWPGHRTVCFLLGIATLAIAWLGPMAAWAHTFFWVHMTQHLLVMMVAAPLFVLSAPVTLVFRACGPQARRRWVVPVLRSRAVRWLTDPVVTWVLFAGVLVGTHFTGFYTWALTNHDADVFLQQPLYLVVAFLYYLPLIGSNLLPHRPPPAARMVSMGLMMVPEAIVGAVIFFAPVVLYSPYETAQRPFGPSVMVDQQLAGALMWALIMVADTFWMILMAAEWFASEERRSHRVDAEVAADVAADVAAGR